MADDILYVSNQDFSRGLQTSFPSHLIEDGASPDCENFDFSDSLGALTKRRGMSELTRQGGTTQTLGLYEFITNTGTKKLVMAQASSLQDVTGPAVAHSNQSIFTYAGSPTVVGFATFDNLMIFVADTETTQKWSGTGASSNLLGTPPSNGRSIAVHKGRCFVGGSAAGRSRLHFSNQSDPEDWTTAGEAGFIDVAIDDGDEIVALASLESALLIFKSRSIWALFGYSPSNFTLTRISPTVGCASWRSVVKCDSFVIFLGQDGVYSTDENGPTMISYFIKPTIENMATSVRSIAAGGKIKNQYWLAYDSDSDGRNDKAYVLDYVYGVWGRYGNVKASCFLRQSTGELYAGGSDGYYIRQYEDNDTDRDGRTKAAGSITCVSGANLIDGETVTIGDGSTSKVFEFDSGGGVTGSNIAVNFTGGDTATTVGNTLAAAINAAASFNVTAYAVSGVVYVQNDSFGTAGNVTITDTVAHASFVVAGLSGGSAGSAITAYYDTKDYDFGDWRPYKHLHDIMVVASPISGKTLTVSHYLDGVVQSDTLSMSLTRAGGFDKVYLRQAHLPAASYSNYIRFRFTNSETDARVKIYAFDIEADIDQRANN